MLRRILPSTRVVAFSLIANVVALALATSARAEHLPIHAYTTADGLGNGRVFHGARDRRGFLWFATADGLSRFDGNRFETFGVADGLPDPWCYDVFVATDGVVWAATEHGLAWLDPERRAARLRFTTVPFGTPADRVIIAIHTDPSGQIWVGSEGGLWRVAADRSTATRVDLRSGGQPFVHAFAEDRYGTQWLATNAGLIRRMQDGRIETYRFPPADAQDTRVTSLLLDRAGRMWVGAVDHGIVVVIPPPIGTPLIGPDRSLWDVGARGATTAPDGTVHLPDAPGAIVRFGAADGFPEHGIRRGIYQDSRGTLWFGGPELVRFDGTRFAVLGPRQGFPETSYAACIEDAAGNMWLGGNATGLLRLAPSGLVTFDERDGLASKDVYAIEQDRAGTIYAITYDGDEIINRFDGERFLAVKPKFPAGVPDLGSWGWNQLGNTDRDGRWWYATGRGVAHYPKVARLEDLTGVEPELFQVADGLPGRDIFRLFEDSRGDLWISTLSATGLGRWNRATNTVESVTLAGLPHEAVVSFAEDRAGAVWIGYTDGSIARVSPAAAGAAPNVMVRAPVGDLVDRSAESLWFDHLGRLWVATSGGGVLRIDQPADASAPITRYTVATGLATDQTSTLVEDARGRIYVGTLRGIDRIDVDTGEIGHLSTADGLPNDYIRGALRDGNGTLWFATLGGVARLVPDDPSRNTPPPAYIVAVRAGGRPLAIAAGGDRAVPALTLDHDDGQLDVVVTSPSFVVGSPVLFQVRLEGADRDWSPASANREVHYAHLAPGRYRFLVRSVYAGGIASAPASLAFEVLPPIWRRPWFVAIAAVLVGLLAWIAYRRRVAHLVAVERVRTRIATDLHDDLGANLSRISILSEVAARRMASGGDAGVVVGDIGRSARELVDVASDIVWSTDPRRDDLGSLVVRLRSYAGDVLDGRDITWSLDAPADPDRIKLGPDERRHLYLVVKEAVNNAARHSDARTVTITIARRDGGLEAVIEDDGRGLDPADPADKPSGNGLVNMRERARLAGGTLTIATPDAGGTRITLRIPLRA